MCTEGATGLSVAGPTGAAGRAGPCVGALRVRGLLGVTGLAVGWPGVCSAGLRVPAGRLAWAVVAAAVGGAAPGCVLPLGAGVAARGRGTPEAVGSSGVPAVAAGARTSVLGAGPAGAAAGPVLAAEVPVARVTAEAVAAPLSSDV